MDRIDAILGIDRRPHHTSIVGSLDDGRFGNRPADGLPWSILDSDWSFYTPNISRPLRDCDCPKTWRPRFYQFKTTEKFSIQRANCVQLHAVYILHGEADRMLSNAVSLDSRVSSDPVVCCVRLSSIIEYVFLKLYCMGYSTSDARHVQY